MLHPVAASPALTIGPQIVRDSGSGQPTASPKDAADFTEGLVIIALLPISILIILKIAP